MANTTSIPELTQNSIQTMLDGGNLDCAILQILGYKKVPGPGTSRFRMLLSDGMTLYPFAILATHLNNIIEGKHLEKFTILKLTKYACMEVQAGKKIIICLEIEPLLPGSVVKSQISLGQAEIDDASNLTNPFQSSLIPPSSSRNLHNNPVASTSNCNDVKATPVENLQVKNSFVGSNANCNNNSTDKQEIVSKKYNTQTINQQNAVVPILSLTPYQNKWTIKARVVYKTPVVTYSNSRGEGKFFTFYLLDESAEIKALAFNNESDLYGYLEVNKVYFISGANIKPSKESSLVKSDFEIMVTDNTKIEPANDSGDVPFLKFNFQPIQQIKTLTKDNYVDVVGVCFSVSNLRTITSKANNREVDKVDLLLIDVGEVPITLSLWGSDAKEFKRQNNPVIVVRNARVTDFNGISLSISQSSMFFINPAITEVFQLRAWFDNLGKTLDVKPLPSSEWKLLSDLTSAEIEGPDHVEYYMTKAIVHMVNKERCMYRSCPSEDCFKKVTELETGKFRCEKCGVEYESCKWTMLLSLNLADFTDSHWAVAFRNAAEAIVGHSAEELARIKEDNNDRYLNVLSALHFKTFIFKLRSKVEVFNDTGRLKTTVLEANPVEAAQYTRKLVADIQRMERILNAE